VYVFPWVDFPEASISRSSPTLMNPSLLLLQQLIPPKPQTQGPLIYS
jgi:hypothetical protein